jgi:hypothetical protein
MKLSVLSLVLTGFLGACATGPMASLQDQPLPPPEISGPCPGAYIDYAYWHRRYRDPLYVPVQVQVAARSALSACKRAGIRGLPVTVAEYNQQSPGIDGREWARQADRVLNPRPLGEF